MDVDVDVGVSDDTLVEVTVDMVVAVAVDAVVEVAVVVDVDVDVVVAVAVEAEILVVVSVDAEDEDDELLVVTVETLEEVDVDLVLVVAVEVAVAEEVAVVVVVSVVVVVMVVVTVVVVIGVVVVVEVAVVVVVFVVVVVMVVVAVIVVIVVVVVVVVVVMIVSVEVVLVEVVAMGAAVWPLQRGPFGATFLLWNAYCRCQPADVCSWAPTSAERDLFSEHKLPFDRNWKAMHRLPRARQADAHASAELRTDGAPSIECLPPKKPAMGASKAHSTNVLKQADGAGAGVPGGAVAVGPHALQPLHCAHVHFSAQGCGLRSVLLHQPLQTSWVVWAAAAAVVAARSSPPPPGVAGFFLWNVQPREPYVPPAPIALCISHVVPLCEKAKHLLSCSAEEQSAAQASADAAVCPPRYWPVPCLYLPFLPSTPASYLARSPLTGASVVAGAGAAVFT